jgi:pimeloyl-ACP methyl ester carboxylesterase
MRRWTFRFLVLFAFLSSACRPQVVTQEETQRIPLENCTLTSPGFQQVEADCGSLVVPEDPSNPQGSRISLKVAVVPAIKRSPESDPLFVLAGGPGQAITEAFPAIYPVFFKIHEDRDIVLVDQRGTGGSNPLRCLSVEDQTLEEDQAIALLHACPEKLKANLRLYTTDIAMQDLDSVRSALGYETIDLYGISYGSRAALTYMKMFPNRVRSVVLDGVVDPEFVLYLDAAQDGQRALDLFFERCEADDACHTAFPDLRVEFGKLIQRLQKSPTDFTMAHPVTEKPVAVTITQETIAGAVFKILYSPDLVSLLPLAIHQAFADENYAPLLTQAYLMNANIYDGMFYAVTCTEDAPLIPPAVAKSQSENSIFGAQIKDFIQICANWPKGKPAPVLREPVLSDTPVLLLSGAADPITPPWHAEKLDQTLKKSLHLVLKGMGHGNITNFCVSTIVSDFISNASVNQLNTSCIDSLTPPPFYIDFNGPRP